MVIVVLIELYLTMYCSNCGGVRCSLSFDDQINSAQLHALPYVSKVRTAHLSLSCLCAQCWSCDPPPLHIHNRPSK